MFIHVRTHFLKIFFLTGVITFDMLKFLWEKWHLFIPEFRREVKPIRYLFSDMTKALCFIDEGRKRYANHKKYTLVTGDMHVARGGMRGALYIDSALAAIMVATGKAPKDYDLNTPAESYGWDFDETRDILNALDGLSRGDAFYWHLYCERHQQRA